MKRLIFLPYAEIDIKDSIDYYRENTEGLEKDFIKIIDSSFREITKNPEAFPKIKFDIRKYVVSKFSFSIFYIDRQDFLYIIAVFHDKRNPKDWRKRSRLIKKK